MYRKASVSISILILGLIFIPTSFAQYDPDGLFQFSKEWQRPVNETNMDFNFDAGPLIDERDLLRLIEGWRSDWMNAMTYDPPVEDESAAEVTLSSGGTVNAGDVTVTIDSNNLEEDTTVTVQDLEIDSSESDVVLCAFRVTSLENVENTDLVDITISLPVAFSAGEELDLVLLKNASGLGYDTSETGDYLIYIRVGSLSVDASGLTATGQIPFLNETYALLSPLVNIQEISKMLAQDSDLEKGDNETTDSNESPKVSRSVTYGIIDSNPSDSLDQGEIPVVLVHGLHSETLELPASEHEHWNRLEQYLNPRAQGKYNVYRYVYDTMTPYWGSGGAISGYHGKSIAEHGSDLRASINARSDWSGRNVILVAHSMGGLVCRSAMLEGSGAGSFSSRVNLLLTLATPHHGSPLATADWAFYSFQQDAYSEEADTQGGLLNRRTEYYRVSSAREGVDHAFEMLYRKWNIFHGKGFRWWETNSRNLGWDNYDSAIPTESQMPIQTRSLHHIVYHKLIGADQRRPESGYFTENFATLSPDEDANDWLAGMNAIDSQQDKYICYAGWDTNLGDNRDYPTAIAVLAPAYARVKVLLGKVQPEDVHAVEIFFDHVGLEMATGKLASFLSSTGAKPYPTSDGFVPFASALYLPAGHQSIEPNDLASASAGDDHLQGNSFPFGFQGKKMRLFPDYDHLDMVRGRNESESPENEILFELIHQDIEEALSDIISREDLVGTWDVIYQWDGYSPGNTVWNIDIDGTLQDSQGHSANWDLSDSTFIAVYNVQYEGRSTLTSTAITHNSMSGTMIIEFSGLSGSWSATKRAQEPQTIPINLPGGVTMDMVLIPAGSFQMGRYPGEQDSYSYEGPQHEVNIGHDFYMGKYEVTKAQWTAVMETAPWSGQSFVLDDPNSPAIYVSWDDIKGTDGFIEKMNALGQGTFRLPSEAEWEYSCRAETTTRFYWGDDPSYTMIGDYAWYRGNASYDVGENYAHVVGLKLPNAWGLHDMSGNVWEWCQDYWHDSYDTNENGVVDAPTDGSAWESPTSSYRVFRGGGWDDPAQYFRSAHRLNYDPGNRYYTVGVRLVRTP